MNTIPTYLSCGIALLVFWVLSGCQSATSHSQSKDSLEIDLDKLVPALLNETHVPGVSIAVIRNHEVVLAKGYGIADKSTNKPITTGTRFQIGSVSKTLTAFAILKLAEEEKIVLDSSVEKYLKSWRLPESKFDNRGVTIRRVLSHTAGLSVRGYHGIFKPGDKLPTLVESLNGYEGSDGALRVVSGPGTHFEYSSGGYTLLQQLIEDVTGISFENYMKEEIFLPLNMKNTGYKWSAELQSKVATPYDENGKAWPHYQYIESASGGVYTTASDLAEFLTLLYQAKKRNEIIKTATVQQIVLPAPGTGGKYGLGTKIFPVNDSINLISHDGANEGWRAAYYLHIPSGDGIIMLTNSDIGGKVGAPIICTVFKRSSVDLSKLCAGILK